MGRRGSPIPACCKKYGVPLYCASWIPLHEIQQQNEDDDDDKETSQSQQSYYLVLGGGGGEGRSGIPNALLLTQFHFSSASLPDQPVDELRTEGDVPYRMAVHPRGEGLVCSFPNTCRWFKWGALENKEDQKVALKLSEKVLRELENVGLQLALAFNSDGSMLASGGEDGHLRVFKWPSMEVLLDQPDAHASVKDLDFSYDGKFLACLGSSGPCRVWDLASLEVVANLPRQNGEVFGFCRFSLRDDDNQLLYVTTMLGKHGGVVSWNTRSWNRGGSRRVVRDQISAFNVSFDGKHLAMLVFHSDVYKEDSGSFFVLFLYDISCSEAEEVQGRGYFSIHRSRKGNTCSKSPKTILQAFQKEVATTQELDLLWQCNIKF